MKTIDSVILGAKQTILHYREYHVASKTTNTWQETVETPCKLHPAQDLAMDCVFHFRGQNIWPLLKQTKSIQFWARNTSKELESEGIVESCLIFFLKNKADVRMSSVKVWGKTVGSFDILKLVDYAHFESLNTTVI